jgi:hypothetical protein
VESENVQLTKELITMKFRLFLTALASLSLIILLSACGTTDYYKDRAVQEARKFLLQEDRTLTLAQREYVKFNKPVIMAAPIFTKKNTASATSGTLSHVCIAWVVPGKKDAYVVFGTSDNRLRYWYPNRVIMKRYDKPARIYHAARYAAMIYGVNNFLYLSNRKLNRIRFEIPETIITDYKFSEATLKSKGLTESGVKSLVQTTFVWSSDSPDKKIFVCGVGAKDLTGWKTMLGGETPVAELRSHFLGTAYFGQLGLRPEKKKKTPEVKKISKVKEEPKVKETPKVKEAPKVKEVPKVKEAVKKTAKIEEIKK